MSYHLAYFLALASFAVIRVDTFGPRALTRYKKKEWLETASFGMFEVILKNWIQIWISSPGLFVTSSTIAATTDNSLKHYPAWGKCNLLHSSSAPVVVKYSGAVEWFAVSIRHKLIPPPLSPEQNLLAWPYGAGVDFSPVCLTRIVTVNRRCRATSRSVRLLRNL